MKRNPTNLAAAADFSQVSGQHELVSECKLNPDQIALALLVGFVAQMNFLSLWDGLEKDSCSGMSARIILQDRPS